MKIFISWSKDQSERIALRFLDWLNVIFENVDTFYSPSDIEKGDRWLSQLNLELERCDFALLFVTQHNLESPWMIFEAGALAKKPDFPVSPILFGVSRSGLQGGPLAQFQSVIFTVEELWRLVLSINKLHTPPVKEGRLRKLFDAFWPSLNNDVVAVLKEQQTADPPAHRDAGEVLEQIIRQDVQPVIRRIQSREPKYYGDHHEASLDMAKEWLAHAEQKKDGDLSIRFLCVSMRFSWPLLDLYTRRILDALPPDRKAIIEVLLLSEPLLAKLDGFGLTGWKQPHHTAIIGLKDLRRKYKDKRLHLEVYEYDNLPHWHGVLIDNDKLFLGRASWQFDPATKELVDFNVGQNEYRLFSSEDQMGSTERINLFNSWFDFYKFSGKEIGLT